MDFSGVISKNNLHYTATMRRISRIIGVGVLILLVCKPVDLHAQKKRGALVLQSTELLICGQTNINEFTCRLLKSEMNDTLATFDRSRTGAAVFEGLEVAFKVDDFLCDVALMTRDFRRLLRSDEYPHIVLRINDITVERQSDDGNHKQVTACVGIQITNIEREQNIDGATIILQEQCVVFTGNHQVRMTNFNIQPPTKLFGTVKTHDLLEILFSIQVL